jgi:hypothetical protein
METINMAKPIVRPINCKIVDDDKILFEQMWKNAISGDEFVKKTHEHIENLYALRDKKRKGCKVL